MLLKELQIAETRAQMNELSSANAILAKIEENITAMLEQGVFVDEGLAILERIQGQRDTTNKILRFKDMSQRVLADISAVAKEEKVKGLIVLNQDIYGINEFNA